MSRLQQRTSTPVADLGEATFVFRMLWWLHLTVAAIGLPMILAGLWLGYLGVDGLRAAHGGISGTVTAASCEPFAKASTCDGIFRSDDGTVQINDVTFFPEERIWPLPPEQALVSSAHATRAHPTASADSWWVPLGAALFFIGGPIWAVWKIYAPDKEDRGAQRQSERRPKQIRRRRRH